MNTLRSVRLILSMITCNLTLIHCGGEMPKPATSESSVHSDSVAAWKTPAAEPAPDQDQDVEAADITAHFANLQRAQKWAYEGNGGPARWGDLSPDYEACKTGTMQSPIDIVRSGVQVDRKLELIDFGYASLPLRIRNDGRTVQLENGTPAAINAAGETWKLVHLQLHSPSEHSVDGKHSALELELVHRNRGGELAVVSLLFDEGKENEALAPVFDALPLDVTDEAVPVAGAAMDLWNVLPAAPSYFTYVGSLTTPDCTEGVRWFVLEPVGEVSEAQLQKLRAVTGAGTNRPIQPLGSRKVLRPQ